MNVSKKIISDKLVVFTRYPVPGKTKTRLIPDLGPAGAAYVHRKLAENIIREGKIIQKQKSVSLEVCFTGGSILQMRTWLGNSLTYVEQEEGDLGARMFCAMERSLQSGGSKVVLIGTDIPGPVSGFIDNAFKALDNRDIVIGPAVDGGYWLVGMKSPFNIFGGIAWGKDTVLRQTLNIAEKKGLSVYLLNPVSDMDTVSDLFEWEPGGDWKNPYISVIIPVFNEEDRIKRVVESVMNMDAEIIVSDGGSSDRTVELARGLGATVVKSQKGRSRQMNSGASASTGNNLLFLHADTMVPENYPELIFKTLLDRRPVVGAFRFKTDMNKAVMKFIEYSVNVRSKYMKLPYGDQGIFTSKADFMRAGSYPDVPVAEDIFFIRKIKKFAEIRTVPETAITSARRWKKHGFIKTTFVNVLIFFGCYLGVKPEKLYALYKWAWSR